MFNKVDYSLEKLILDIDIGEIGLPEIQRPFVWKNTKVRDLFDSMYRGFPVGYLLFWANGMANGHKQIGVDGKQKTPRLLIVDGQQRLTSLYAVMKGIPVVRGNYSREKILIAFRPRDQTFDVADAAIRKDPEFIPDISLLLSDEVKQHHFVRQFLSRLDLADQEEEDRIAEAIGRLYSLKSYPFTALELSSQVDEEQVAEVFVRINSSGTPLNQADFILTLMSVFWDQGRTDLEEFCRDARQPSAGPASPFNAFIKPDPDQLLRASVALGFRRARLQHVYSILRGKALETGEFSDTRRHEQFAVLQDAQSYVIDLQNWHEYLKVLISAGYLSGGMITSLIGLLYSYALYLIGKREFHVEPYRLRGVIARWFFMAALTARYTSSSESQMEQDLGRLRDAGDAEGFVRLLDGIIADTLTEDYWNITLPNALATPSARSPSLFAYHAALNLLEAKVLFSEVPVSQLLAPHTHAPKSATERHHLFPRAYLTGIGIDEQRSINQIANYALVEWSDNVAISDTPPSAYFPLYARRFSPNELSRMCYWHALPAHWETMEYTDFLAARRKLISVVIRDGFSRLADRGKQLGR